MCCLYLGFSPGHNYRVKGHESNTALSIGSTALYSTQTILVLNPCTTNKVDEAIEEDVLRYFLKRRIFPQAQTVFIKSQLSSHATSQV